METQRKIVVIAVVAVLAVAGASVLSPWWTLSRMRAAIEARDYKAFSSYVDYPALRASFKSQLVAKASGTQANDSESLLDAFGEGIAAALAGPMLDVVLDAPGVMEMINQGAPTITRAVIASAITRVPSTGQVPVKLKAAYRGWGSVGFRGAEAPERDGSFILLRSGFWSWRLAEAELARKG